MDITTGLLIIAGVYAVLMFFDNFFKTCAHYPYIQFLEGTGFQIKFLTLTWKTKAFNRTLIRWGNSKPKFFNLWFTCGLYCTVFLLPISIFLIIYTTYQIFTLQSGNGANMALRPIIPGVTIPFSELGYYILTLLVSSIFHEMGHALAAVLENVPLIEVGTKFFFIFPAAFVNISTEKFATLTRKRTLKILCAGVWHNLFLAIVAYIIYMFLPIIFSCCYQINKGVTVVEITKNSPLLHQRGLKINDVVTRVNDCEVKDEFSWYECLELQDRHKISLCINDDLIHNLDESIPLQHLDEGTITCCDINKKENVCWEYLDLMHGVLELPSYACLPGRIVIEKSTKYCTFKRDICPESAHCFRPILGNDTSLFKIISDKKIVIYMGLASDVYNTVEISPYIADYYFKSAHFPFVVTKLFKYLIVFSLGLAVMNVVPCVQLDGQHILETVFYPILRKQFSKKITKVIIFAVITICTSLILILCLHTIVKRLI